MTSIIQNRAHTTLLLPETISMNKIENKTETFEEVRIRNNSFHSDFAHFRAAIQLKRVLRKSRLDSLLKKCKSKLFKTIQEAINILLGTVHRKENKLPQVFITNINIEYNKKFFDMTLEEIYKEFGILKSLDELTDLMIDKSDKQKNKLKYLMNMTYKESFEAYLSSNRYFQDYEYIKNREGEKYAILFDYAARVFVRYFKSGKGNKKLKANKEKKKPFEKDIVNIENSIYSESGIKETKGAELENYKTIKKEHEACKLKKFMFKTY